MATPTKGIRSSPRKKAWASPPKAENRQLIGSMFNEDDFSPLNQSWAEVTEQDTSLTEALMSSVSKSEGRTRKAAAPIRRDTKPKFVRSLQLTEEVMGRRSARIRGKEGSSSKKVEESVDRMDILDSAKQSSRKRHLSTTSTVTLDEGCSPAKRTPLKNRGESSSGRPSRKSARDTDESGKKSPARQRLFGKAPASPSSGSEFSMKDYWEDPTLGWCQDQPTIERRNKELTRAKEKEVYTRYISEIPRHKRVKGVHPKTPNKHINFSRRSWDTQVRNWKKSLYNWAGEDPSDSVNTSFCSYTSEEMKAGGDEDLENKPVLEGLQDIMVRPETDAMASLLGRFDMDTRQVPGDESTLKAPTTDGAASGPTDFSAGLGI